MNFSSGGLRRLHVYELGSVHLAGLAVGTSDVNLTIKMVQSYSNVTDKEQYCTFYFNKGNFQAEKVFSHHPLPNPGSQSVPETGKIYGDEFTAIMNEMPNFLTCAKAGAMALGCNGQKHRGPTVFGMLLAFTGCEPQHAADIVNSVWGLNGVPPENRLAAIQKGYFLGIANPNYRDKLRALFDAQ